MNQQVRFKCMYGLKLCTTFFTPKFSFFTTVCITVDPKITDKLATYFLLTIFVHEMSYFNMFLFLNFIPQLEQISGTLAVISLALLLLVDCCSWVWMCFSKNFLSLYDFPQVRQDSRFVESKHLHKCILTAKERT